jgi:hypothetical protein
MRRARIALGTATQCTRINGSPCRSIIWVAQGLPLGMMFCGRKRSVYLYNISRYEPDQ